MYWIYSFERFLYPRPLTFGIDHSWAFLSAPLPPLSPILTGHVPHHMLTVSFRAGEPVHAALRRHVADGLWEAHGIGRICGVWHPVRCSLRLPGWWQRGGRGFYPLRLWHTPRKDRVCKHRFSQPIPAHLLYQLQPSRQSALRMEQLQRPTLPSGVHTPTAYCRWETMKDMFTICISDAFGSVLCCVMWINYTVKVP